jgi:hypothetical protein
VTCAILVSAAEEAEQKKLSRRKRQSTSEDPLLRINSPQRWFNESTLSIEMNDNFDEIDIFTTSKPKYNQCPYTAITVLGHS